MTIQNMEIVQQFNKLANLLEIEGANPFRIRAYRNAARMLAGLTTNVSDLIAAGENLADLPGIGKDLAEKITVLVTTGEFPLLKETEARLPALLNDLMNIEGLGPKRIQIIYKKLKIKNIQQLEAAIAKGKLRSIKGFGAKTEQKILQGIARLHEAHLPTELAKAAPIVDALTHYLKTFPKIKKIMCAGSFRRRKETINDLDFVVASAHGESVINYFVRFPQVDEILSQGSTKASLRLKEGIQVDLRVVPAESYGAALLYFTGSKEHNIAIRKIALKKKLKVNEYGVFRGNKYLVGVSEEEIYAKIGLTYIPPELREDRGEIAVARQNKLPNLISLEDIYGDLHCYAETPHLKALIQSASARGYEYLALTHQSQDKKTLANQLNIINKLRAQFKNIELLTAIQVEILENGKLNLADDILKTFDLVIGVLVNGFNLPSKKQTERLRRALLHPLLSILAHPTGRLINEREPYAFDVETIIKTAAERKCLLELNAKPNRLDLNDRHCKLAKERGAKIVLGTEAETAEQLDYMTFGVYQARRGWLEKEDVVNTWPLTKLKTFLKR